MKHPDVLLLQGAVTVLLSIDLYLSRNNYLLNDPNTLSNCSSKCLIITIDKFKVLLRRWKHKSLFSNLQFKSLFLTSVHCDQAYAVLKVLLVQNHIFRLFSFNFSFKNSLELNIKAKNLHILNNHFLISLEVLILYQYFF